VKLQQLFPSLLLTGSYCLFAAQPAFAQQLVQVTQVQLRPTADGLELVLQTADGSKPQVLTSSADKTVIADIPNAQLNLAEGNEFRATNPAEGIVEVTVVNLTPNSVQIRVTGVANVPTAIVAASTEPGLILSVQPQGESAQQPPTPTTPEEEPIEIVVTATRTEEPITNVPRSVTVINREQLQQQTEISNTRNLADILPKIVPGLGVPTQSPILNSTSGLRGRFPQVLIDGVPIKSNLFTSQARDLNTIDPSAIERIEIVRGPTATYGDGGTGGVINIITRRPSEEKVTTRVEVGVNGSAVNDNFFSDGSTGNDIQFGISGTQDNFDYTISLARNEIGSYFDAQGDRIPNDDGQLSDSTGINVLGKFGINFDSQQRLELTLNHQNNQRDSRFFSDPSVFDIPGIQKARAIERPAPQPIGAESPEDLTTVLNLNYTNNNVFGGSKLQAQVYYRDNLFRGTFFDGRPFGFTGVEIAQFVFNKDLFGGRVQVETPLSSTLALLWGADYSEEDLTFPINSFDPVAFDNSGGRVLRRIDEISNPGNYSVNNLGLFAQLRWDVSEKFLVNGGLRYERFGLSVDDYQTEEFGFIPNRDIKGGNINFDDVVFNLGAVYKFTEQFSVFANFAQGFSAPDYSRILANPPEGFTSIDQDLNITQPQKVNNYEIGVRGNWPNVQASLSGFFNESELGLRIIPGQAGRFASIERQPQQIYGLEASLDWQPAKGWGLGSTISWAEGEFEDATGDSLALSSRDISPLKLTAYLQYETPGGWRNRVQALHVAGRDRAFEDGTDPVEIEGYTTVDFISSIPLFNGRLSFSVENLLNEQYFPVLSQYLGGFDETLNSAGRGRTIRLGYSLSW
jgi:iron complex outermembrane receptor protein